MLSLSWVLIPFLWFLGMGTWYHISYLNCTLKVQLVSLPFSMAVTTALLGPTTHLWVWKRRKVCRLWGQTPRLYLLLSTHLLEFPTAKFSCASGFLLSMQVYKNIYHITVSVSKMCKELGRAPGMHETTGSCRRHWEAFWLVLLPFSLPNSLLTEKTGLL